MQNLKHANFMEKALGQADLAEKKGDIPIGAIIVKSGKIIVKAHNRREYDRDATAHAEIVAIRLACKKLDQWILDDCQLYVTLEPCVMCFGAIIQSRISQVYFGAYDPKTGACGSLAEIENLTSSSINHHTTFTGGILEDRCSNKLKTFFAQKREKQKHYKALNRNI